jgi:hypothetical protein
MLVEHALNGLVDRRTFVCVAKYFLRRVSLAHQTGVLSAGGGERLLIIGHLSLLGEKCAASGEPAAAQVKAVASCAGLARRPFRDAGRELHRKPEHLNTTADGRQ